MANGDFPQPTEDGPKLRKPLHEERPLKIICVGAGASGLFLAYKLQRSFEKFELVVYEKNDAVSGTWHENRYPGCACDVPAHIYTWSFEPNPSWSSVYASSEEIFQYFDNFCDKYDLRKYCRLRHEVTKASWNEDKGNWHVEVTHLETGITIRDTCDILINACGILNVRRWPSIPGLEKYRGKLLHTAKWDPKTDLEGKHVGVIGNGSSGIQVLPGIRSQASKITAFIRGPTWVAPVQGLEQRHYSEEERREFVNDPDTLLNYRKAKESNLNAAFPMFISNSDVQKNLFEDMVGKMKAKLQNETLEQLLIPKWAVGCRRITPGVNYLETLVSEKVDVVYGGIQRITEQGCVSDDGKEHPVDVLICATGFETSYRPRFPIIGSGGKNLADVWADEPQSYLGMAAAGFPNYFMFLGPNSPIGNGPLLYAIEAQAAYMLKIIDRWQTENIHSFSPKMEAVEDFIAYKDQFMKGAIWGQNCRSWYKNHSSTGKVVAVWPGSSLHYVDTIAEPRYDDWNFTYTGNRFNFLGNGFSQTECDRTADWAYYLRNEDDSPYISRGKRRKDITRSGTMFHPETNGPLL